MFLRPREAAMSLGCHVYSIYQAVYQGAINAVKVEGCLRIPRDEVEKILLRKKRLKSVLKAKDVATLLACSQSTVLRLLRKGKIRAEKLDNKFNGVWIILPQDLEDYVMGLRRKQCQ